MARRKAQLEYVFLGWRNVSKYGPDAPLEPEPSPEELERLCQIVAECLNQEPKAVGVITESNE